MQQPSNFPTHQLRRIDRTAPFERILLGDGTKFCRHVIFSVTGRLIFITCHGQGLNSQYKIRDTSSNGTLINDKEISGVVILKEGDIIKFEYMNSEFRPGVFFPQKKAVFIYVFERIKYEGWEGGKRTREVACSGDGDTIRAMDRRPASFHVASLLQTSAAPAAAAAAAPLEGELQQMQPPQQAIEPAPFLPANDVPEAAPVSEFITREDYDKMEQEMGVHLEAARKERYESDEKLKSSEEQLLKTQSKLEECDSAFSDLHKAHESLVAEGTEKSEEIKRLEAVVSAKEEEQERLRATVHSLKIEKDYYNSLRQKAVSENKKLLEEIEEARKASAKKDEQMAALMLLLDDLKKKVEKTQVSIDDNAMRLAELEACLRMEKVDEIRSSYRSSSVAAKEKEKDSTTTISNKREHEEMASNTSEESKKKKIDETENCDK